MVTFSVSSFINIADTLSFAIGMWSVRQACGGPIWSPVGSELNVLIILKF